MARGPAARGLTKNVVKGGLLVNPRVSGTLWVGMLPLIGLGIAYLVAAIQNQEPGGGNVAILLCLAVGGTAKLIRLRHQLTQAGDELLSARRQRGRNGKAASAEVRPALVVALFGASVLWTLDPAIASGWAEAPQTMPQQRADYYNSVGRGPDVG